jgi:hypothetical protein
MQQNSAALRFLDREILGVARPKIKKVAVSERVGPRAPAQNQGSFFLPVLEPVP